MIAASDSKQWNIAWVQKSTGGSTKRLIKLRKFIVWRMGMNEKLKAFDYCGGGGTIRRDPVLLQRLQMSTNAVLSDKGRHCGDCSEWLEALKYVNSKQLPIACTTIRYYSSWRCDVCEWRVCMWHMNECRGRYGHNPQRIPRSTHNRPPRRSKDRQQQTDNGNGPHLWTTNINCIAYAMRTSTLSHFSFVGLQSNIIG